MLDVRSWYIDDAQTYVAVHRQKIMANVNFSNYESRNWFDRMLRNAGLFDRLEEMASRTGTW